MARSIFRPSAAGPRGMTVAVGALWVALIAVPATAFGQATQPGIDGDLMPGAPQPRPAPPAQQPQPVPYPSPSYSYQPAPAATAAYRPQPLAGPQPLARAPADGARYAGGSDSTLSAQLRCVAPRGRDGTYQQDDLIGAATGIFGTAARGLAEVIQDILKKQGRPDAYITGREAGGAIAVGLRYGSGTLCHAVEGRRPVYWTGPSIGFDAGASAGQTFVLVYNLYNSQDLFRRFGSGEGQAYLLGGFNVSYMRRGSVVLVPVRMGVGLRLGVNGGYMKFSPRQNWFPF